MKTLADQMAVYAAYHEDPRNKATHFAGVPAIMLALFIPLSWLAFDAGPVPITAAMLLGGAVLLYYFVLDIPLALAMLAITAALIALAQAIAGLGAAPGWAACGALFVGGWALQLLGHAFEGRKPALVDNLFQVFIAPIFLCAEILFALGYRQELHAAVRERAERLRRRRAPLAPG